MKDPVTLNAKDDIAVIYAAQEQVRPGSRFGPVVRSTYIFECCTKGGGCVFINGTQVPFTAGQSYVLLPGDTVIHTSDSVTGREGYWCSLGGSSIGAALESIGITSETPFLPPELFHEICGWFAQLSQQWKCRDTGARFRQLSCAYGLLGVILKNKPEMETASLIDKVISLMQAHYPDSLHIGDIAQQVGLERSYFSRLFREKTGLSPYRYLTRLRMEKACQLLDAQEYSVSEISYMVGLEPHNFARIFKGEIGKTPKEYQRKA